MGNIALRVENLGKQYFIGTKKKKHVSLVESIAAAFKDPFRRLKGQVEHGESGDTKPFWALQDVSFELKHGQVLGIIGRNGSGKSTLLKIIANVLDPTTGQVELYGRVGSLLEVGMGFHPELTGRENIYLSGAIMGMKRAEIDRKLDEIVDFSDMEEFIDTPVKRYSSGMYVRLAFSVAAQLDPEILVLDEVLSVGDQVFQRKCLQKMHQVATDGRTVLFVSHGMASVRQLCDSGMLLSDGSVVKLGTVDEVVDHYLDVIADDLTGVTTIENQDDLPRLIGRLPPDPVFALKDVSIVQGGEPRLVVGNGGPIEIKIKYEVLEESPGLFVFFRVYNTQGMLLFESLHNGTAEYLPIVSPGQYISTGTIPADFLLPERHELWVGAAIFGKRACLPEMLRFNLNVQRTGIVSRAYPKRRSQAAIAPLILWNTESLDKTGLPLSAALRVEPAVAEQVWENLATAPGSDNFRFHSVRVRNTQGLVTGEIDSQEPFDVEIEYWNLQDGARVGTTLVVWNADTNCILSSLNNRDAEWHGRPRPKGLFRSICSLPGNFFGAGHFTMTCLLWTYGYGESVQLDKAVSINVSESKGSYRGDYTGEYLAAVCPVLPWKTIAVKDISAC